MINLAFFRQKIAFLGQTWPSFEKIWPFLKRVQIGLYFRINLAFFRPNLAYFRPKIAGRGAFSDRQLLPTQNPGSQRGPPAWLRARRGHCSLGG